ncbi:MAG: M14 family metallopeptidase [Bacteroidales bacterium]
MKLKTKLFILFIISVMSFTAVNGQKNYDDYKAISQKAGKLAGDYPGLCSVKSLAKTSTGKDIWVISIGPGERDNKPAIAVVGGLDSSPLGSTLALGFADKLLRESSNQEIKDLLGKVTFYIFPDVNPDAETLNGVLKYDRSYNARSTDDDKDFTFDEDPFEDMNGDGLITLMRVTDPTGTMVESTDDKRILVPADLSKGQKGTYFVYSEGTDNDKDGAFNEDGAGGVSFNKNFTFNYEEYGTNAGFHAVSEPETKAVADFLYDHFNIYTVITFGPQDNLGQPMRMAERPGAQENQQGQPGMQGQMQFSQRMQGDRRVTSIMRTDETVNRLVSEKYHDITGLKGAPVTRNTPGNFMDWAYYHYGRYSFSTPGWWFPSERGKNAEAAYLKYAADNKLTDVFVDWKEIKHPDFPDKKVEVGGIKPMAMNTPTDSIKEVMINKHYKFITEVAGMHPELELVDLKVENLGENIFRVTVKLHNKGLFATVAEVGDFNQWTRIMRVTFNPLNGQTFLNGQKITRARRLEGDQSAEFSWLLSGKGQARITAGALNTGTVSTVVELK